MGDIAPKDQERTLHAIKELRPESHLFVTKIEGRLRETGSLEKALTLPELEIKNLKDPDYIAYLNLIGMSSSTRIIINNLALFYEKFQEKMERRYKPSEEKSLRAAISIGEATGGIFWALTEDEEAQVTPDFLKKFYKLIESENQLVRHFTAGFIPSLIGLDERNKGNQEYVGLLGKLQEDITKKITSQQELDFETVVDLVDSMFLDFPEYLPAILLQAMRGAENEEIIKRVFVVFARKLSIEESQKILAKYALEDKDFATLWKKVEETLGFKPKAAILHPNPEDLYQQLRDFNEYEPSRQLTEFEFNLLERELKNAPKILDVGCGYGRLLLRFREKGKDVVGIDITQKHINYIKNEDQDTQVILASWHALPFQEDTFDGAYFLGRSILHEVTPEDMTLCLRGIGRAIKTGGSLIVDIPDPDSGHFLKEKEKFIKTVENLGEAMGYISYFQEGSIVDSPDNIHYSSRFAPSKEQFKAIANLAGFDAEVILAQDYTNEGGEKNRNLYWRLKKRSEILNAENFLQAFIKAYPNGPQVELSFFKKLFSK